MHIYTLYRQFFDYYQMFTVCSHGGAIKKK